MKGRRNISIAVLKSVSIVCKQLKELPLTRRFGLAVVGAVLLSLLPATAEAESQNYGAIAVDPTSLISGVSFGGSQAQAVSAAMNQCNANGGSSCTAYLWFRNGYGALATSINHRFGTGWGTDARYAENYSIKICQDHGGVGCSVQYTRRTPGAPAESPNASGGTLGELPNQLPGVAIPIRAGNTLPPGNYELDPPGPDEAICLGTLGAAGIATIDSDGIITFAAARVVTRVIAEACAGTALKPYTEGH
jgi:hypothetical protein